MSLLDAGATRRDWPAHTLADWEILADIHVEQDPVRLAALAAKRDDRQRDRAAALAHARQLREEIEQRVAALLGTAGARS